MTPAERDRVLPTEPHTVIGIAWKTPGGAFTGRRILEADRVWRQVRDVDGGPWGKSEELLPRITGFEVLAEPVSQDHGDEEDSITRRLREARRETARALIARLRGGDVDFERMADVLARDFGVTSQPDPAQVTPRIRELEQQLETIRDLCVEARRSVGSPDAWLLANKILKAVEYPQKWTPSDVTSGWTHE